MTTAAKESLRAATILGIGAVTPLGRDLGEIARKLGESAEPASPILRVGDELLAEAKIAKSMRRADRFVRMATIAALDAWTSAESSCVGIEKEQIGLIVTSGLGPHCRGFKFLDGILDCGDSDALPTDFSHSVHGAAASYIAGLLDLRGPSLSTTDFEIGFEQAVLLAQVWLDQGVCQRVVVGAVEELGDVLTTIAGKMLPADESIQISEGAFFLVLGPGDMAGIAHLDAGTMPEEVELMMVDEPAIPAEVLGAIPIARKTISFSRFFGHSACSSAFQLLGGLISMMGKPAPVDNATTFRTSCGRAATLLLRKI